VLMPLGVLSQYIFGPLLFLLSFFIIAIILLQRGRGGGLTGALGGVGGQSAFGVKAGDIFTRVTAITVLLWIFTCALAAYWYKPEKLDIEADVSSTPTNTIGAGTGGFGGALPSGEGLPGVGEGNSLPGIDIPAGGTILPGIPSTPADGVTLPPAGAIPSERDPIPSKELETGEPKPALTVPDDLKPIEPSIPSEPPATVPDVPVVDPAAPEKP